MSHHCMSEIGELNENLMNGKLGLFKIDSFGLNRILFLRFKSRHRDLIIITIVFFFQQYVRKHLNVL